MNDKEKVLGFIRKRGNKWCVISHKGKELGCYDTREAAVKRLREIEYFKHHGSDDCGCV